MHLKMELLVSLLQLLQTGLYYVMAYLEDQRSHFPLLVQLVQHPHTHTGNYMMVIDRDQQELRP